MALLQTGLLGMIAGFMALFVIFVIALYIYMALALSSIAKRTNTKDPWLAWIPIANIYLATQIAKVPGWVTLSIILPFIPVLGSIAFVIVWAWLWWKIAEIRKRPGWWGILIAIIPIVNLVLIGILAWDKK